MDAEQRLAAQRLSQYREQLAAQNAKAAMQAREAQEKADGQNRIPTHSDPLIYPGLYAPSGFDMMSILVRVATRPNPTIPLGAIDSSCALLLCDLHAPDVPIVYVSEPFTALTHYTESEILGRNCRFLQAPDGKVVPGQKRVYTDEQVVFELKQKVGPGAYTGNGDTVEKGIQEVQVCLKNYKKGGEAFENLLTVVPIAWDEGGQLRYVVGFQVDRAEAFV